MDIGFQDSIIPVLKTNKAAMRRLIHTDKHGLVELPSDASWLFNAKPPFTKPLICKFTGVTPKIPGIVYE